MKKVSLLFAVLLFAGMTRAQILNVAAGTNLTIQAGTTFRADSLTLIPSADFILTNITLTKGTTVIHTSVNPYISHVYKFSNITNAYTGAVQINYDDAELNGIPEPQLTLNIHNGTTSWIYYPATVRDGTNNYVLSNGVIINGINELTLAHLSTPLPLAWLSFTATKQNKNALLQWSTMQEQNTRNYTVQHSANGVNWTNIGTQLPAGNTNITSNYSHLHTTPVTGINYYRILQTGFNNRNSYSIIRTLKFTTDDEPFIIIGNPVTNNILTVQVNISTGLSFYTAEGKLLWQEQVSAGTKYIDVSRYAKGTYFLKANNSSQKVLIQ
jgi:Secretion system C-terminal sorting domain